MSHSSTPAPSDVEKAHVESAASDIFAVEIQEVKDGIYLAYRPEPLRLFVDGNTTIIVNERDVVVVDAGGSPEIARRVIAEIKKLTPNPVSYLVNTHIHRDHRFGNQEYVKAYPGVEIVARTGIRDIVTSTGERYLSDLIKRIDGPPTDTERELARLRAERAPGSDAVIAHLERFLEQDLARIRSSYHEVVNTPPTVTFEHEFVLHRGQRVIQIQFLGHGDTPDDAIVYLPHDRIVCTGDMVVHPFPYGYSDAPLEWRATLGRLAQLEFDYLIPGHGAVQRGKTYLGSVMALLHSIEDQVQAGITAGLALDRIRQRINVTSFEKSMTGDDPILRYYFKQYFVDPNVERTWHALNARAKR